MTSASTTVSRPGHAPADATALAALVRAAAREGRGLRIRGAGRWTTAHAPGDTTDELTTTAMAGITAYTPADLTLSCGAGTTLAELEAATRVHDQWCPLLPWGDDLGTVGATAATATAGPFADRLGAPSTLVLGLECVDGTGRVIQAGGRVVKNVAGFDLTRLMIGAWGTLGVITQLHLRLRARPAVDRTMVLEAPPSAVDAVTAFGRGPYAPLALLAMDAGAAWTTMAGAIPAATDPSARRWMVRIGGNAPFVAAAQDALARLGRLTIVDGETVWSFVRQHAAPRSGPGPWRWDTLSTRLRDRFDPHRVLNPGLLDAV
jgi:glycolate oxidase FAD binding subunit